LVPPPHCPQGAARRKSEINQQLHYKCTEKHTQLISPQREHRESEVSLLLESVAVAAEYLFSRSAQIKPELELILVAKLSVQKEPNENSVMEALRAHR
jgi:hypothetical protein